jgi:transcriptional regulator of acetoin/glycerol metabolism
VEKTFRKSGRLIVEEGPEELGSWAEALERHFIVEYAATVDSAAPVSKGMHAELARAGDALEVGAGAPRPGWTAGGFSSSPAEPAVGEMSYGKAREQCLRAFERAYLSRLLEAAAGSISQASRLSGMDRANLRRLLRRHQMHGKGVS